MRLGNHRCGVGCSRAVARALLVIILATAFPVQAVAGPFTDVPAGHWAYRALEQLSEAGLVDGYPAGFFSGSRLLTRYEVALTVTKALQRLGQGALDAGPTGDLSVGQLWHGYNDAHPEDPLPEDVPMVLSRVVSEFQPELAMLGHQGPAADPGTVEMAAADATGFAAEHGSADGTEVVADSSAAGPLQQGIGMAGAQDLADYGLPGSWLALGGTAAILQAAPIWGLSETVSGVSSVVPVTPYFSLRAGRALRSGWQGEAGATAVGASVRLGDVSVDGHLRTVEPGFETGFSGDGGGEALGVDLSLPLGDLRLITGRDVVQRAADSVEHVTSLALEYNLAQRAQIRAQWESVSLADLRDARHRTSVGLNMPVGPGAVHLGLAYEDGTSLGSSEISVTTLTVAGYGLRLLDNAEAEAAFALQNSVLGSQRAASLGLRYSLSPEAWLRLGYKLINFTDSDRDSENVATAEFAIRF